MGPARNRTSLLPNSERDKIEREKISAAAIRTGIAAVELLDVELPGRKRPASAGLSRLRTKIEFVSGIAAPFAEAAPGDAHGA
jgi:hypothetical protein